MSLRRRIVTLLAATALAALSPIVPAAADGANALQPSTWPQGPDAAPRLEGWAHGLRLSGPDRYQTNLAASLALRGEGDYPFSSPDRTSGGAGSLPSASDWWGADVCPTAVIVVAGDNFADALAATALSDPADQPGGPLLERVAAADPLFDPPGGFARVDLANAPILVTTSGREGATTLAVPTRLAAQDFAAGGCTTARTAVIVGGVAAVPRSIETDLLGIGYTQVFRVAGVDRFDTAARVAQALGTAEVPSPMSCVDPVVNDGSARMGVYAPSVIEYRSSATTCEVLSRTVVLADGGTGADALAAGWWTSFWQVPVLFTDAEGRLPAPTRAALQTLHVNNLIVLGGPSRIPDATVAEALLLTSGAAVRRVAGEDRYATAAEMARRFGGWFTTSRSADGAGSLFCLAASGGDGAESRGWPDALGAGPWCAAAAGAASNPGAPERALAPSLGGDPAETSGTRPARDAVPVLLAATGAETLPAPTAALLAGAFPSTGSWCSGSSAPAGCAAPGFAVAFGGPLVVTETALAEAVALASGSTVPGPVDQAPALSEALVTALDLSPVFASGGSGTRRACVPRGAVSEARWVAAYDGFGLNRFVAAEELVLARRYLADADGVARGPGRSAPLCVPLGSDPAGALVAISLAGRASAPVALPASEAVRLADPIVQAANGSSGEPSESTALGAVTVWGATATPPAGNLVLLPAGDSAPIQAAALSLTLTRAAVNPGPAVFSGLFSITTPGGTVVGSVQGEAVLAGGAVWRLRGRAVVTGGTLGAGAGTGGFTADVELHAPGTADDVITWRLDAFR